MRKAGPTFSCPIPRCFASMEAFAAAAEPPLEPPPPKLCRLFSHRGPASEFEHTTMRRSPLQTVSDRDNRYINVCGGCYPNEKLKNDKARLKGAQLSLQLYTPLHFSVLTINVTPIPPRALACRVRRRGSVEGRASRSLRGWSSSSHKGKGLDGGNASNGLLLEGGKGGIF